MSNPEERESNIPDSVTSDTNNATTIHPEEAPPDKQEKFERLRSYNMGLWNGSKRENTEMFRTQDNLHRYDSIASSCDLTGHQKSRGRELLQRLDNREIGLRIDLSIFAICVIVANEDVECGNRYYPESPEMVERFGPEELQFVEVADSLGFGWEEQISTIEKLRRELGLL